MDRIEVEIDKTDIEMNKTDVEMDKTEIQMDKNRSRIESKWALSGSKIVHYSEFFTPLNSVQCALEGLAFYLLYFAFLVCLGPVSNTKT